jgi:hypothetical protein
MSKSVELANAIVERINTGHYQKQFKARRLAVPIVEAEKLTDLLVAVFTGTLTTTQITRDTFERTYKPIVTVQKRLQPGSDAAQEVAQADELQNLVEEIEERLAGSDLARLSFLGFEEGDERDTYGLEPMRDHKVFAASITLHYTD